MAFILVVNTFFAYYFFAIGFWWVALIPLFFSLVMFFSFYDISSWSKNFFQKNIQSQFLSYIWILFNIWLSGLLRSLLPYFGIQDEVVVFLMLIIFNVFLFFYSFFIDYEDGKNIFQAWYYFNWFMLGFYYIFQTWNSDILKVFVWSTTWVYAFLRSIIGLVKKLDKNYQYILVWWSLVLISSFFSSSEWLIFGTMGQIIILLFLCIAYQYHFKAKKIEALEVSGFATYKDMILNHKPYISYTRLDKKNNIIFLVQKFFSDLPSWFKLGLAILSSLYLFIIVFYFLNNIWYIWFFWFQIFLWLSLALYWFNFFLSKKLHYTHSLQRYVLFFWVNLWVYLSIINMPTNWDNFWVVLLWIIWALWSNAILQVVRQPWNNIWKNLSTKDYQVWILANVVLSLINIYFMVHYSFSNQVTLFLVIIFVSLQAFITYYDLASIKK